MNTWSAGVHFMLVRHKWIWFMESTLAEDEKESVVFVISGAFTMHLGRFPSLYKSYYRRLMTSVGAHELLVPLGFGALPIEHSYKKMEELIEHKLERHDPSSLVTFVGHSLGGALAARYHCEHPERPSQVISIAGAFGNLAVRSFYDDHLDGNTRRIVEHAKTHDVRIDLIGSDRDHLVPPTSALPDIPGARRYLLSAREPERLHPSITHVEANLGHQAHLSLVRHEKTLELCAIIMNENMLMSV